MAVGEGEEAAVSLPEHIQSTCKVQSDKDLSAPLTVGPGLPDPQGLHWLLTGEFLLAVETGMTCLHYEEINMDELLDGF